jgi:hypothetical protein
MAAESFEAGDQLVLTVPVVHAVENDPWSTVTFSLANRQWVTIRQDAQDIVKVVRASTDANVKLRAKPEPVQDSMVKPTDDGRTSISFKVESGEAEYVLSAGELIAFATRIISEAGRRAASTAGLSPHLGSALPTKIVSIDRHPTEATSAIVALRVGELELAFDIETNALLQTVKGFLDRRRSSPKHDPDHPVEPSGDSASEGPLTSMPVPRE